MHFHLNHSKSHGYSQMYVISLAMSCYWILEYVLLPYYFYFALVADLK